MQYDKNTGTFFTSNTDGSFTACCRGFYGTETHKLNSVDLTPPANRYWAVTEAKNGTGLRLFSLPIEEFDSDWEPWFQTNDRVWYLATYKNLSGHLGRWKDGSKKTFGKMFEEILGEEGIQKVLQATSGDLCISYFMRHRENDIHNEMGDEESHVIQTIVWDRSTQQYVGPCMPNWPMPEVPVRQPTLLYSNIQPKNETISFPFFNEGETIKIEDGHPLLLTVYDGANIMSYKLITYADEYVRQFRSRSHSRFVALMVCEELAKTGKAEHIEELQIAKARLFTDEELQGFNVNVQAGKDEFYAELDNKYYGQYVAFDKKIFNNCRIKDCLDEFSFVTQMEDPEQFEQNRQAFKDKVWEKLRSCTSWRKVGALESFWRVYVRANFN